jgi:uncharacterized protein (DUF58 family)
MKNFFWFLIPVAIIGLAFLFRSPYAAYSIYAFLLLVGVANVSSLLWLSGLECSRSISRDVLRQGEETEVDVTIENTRGWPIPWIFVEDFYPRDFPRVGDNSRLAVLMPGQSIHLNYRLTCPRRGYHRIGPLMMETGDLFGLQKRFKTGQQQDYISVLPNIAYIETFTLSARRPQGPVRIASRIYEDPSRLAGIREYQPGDPLNRIHWKASARTGDLYTKTYEPATVIGGTLLLDLHANSYAPEGAEERLELAITVTASIAYLLQASGEQVGMLTNAFDAAEVAKYEADTQGALSRQELEDSVESDGISDAIRPLLVPTAKSSIQARTIAENLARVVPGEGLDVEQLLLTQFHGFPRDAAILPVVPQVTARFAMLLAEMKAAGFAVSVFLIKDPKRYDEAAGLLAPHNIHVFHIEHERHLHELSPARIGQ